MNGMANAMARADRMLFLAFAVVLATASASLSAASSPSARQTGISEAAASIAISPYDLSPNPIVPVSIPHASPAVAAQKQLLSEYSCLSEVMYYEARGEGSDGQKAVAEVVLHRLKSGTYGSTICAVVYQGAAGTYCQFTFACDGSLEKPKEPESWRKAQVLAAQILVREAALTETTGGATFYHATSVLPRWAGKLTRTAQIGNHVFYRQQPDGTLSVLRFRGPL